MSLISRIISMRDADRPRKSRATSQKQYALACELMQDDSDSCYADDEYCSDDELLIFSSSSESSIEQGDDSCEVGHETNRLNIIEDYFNDPMPSSQGAGNTPQEDDPPVMKLTLVGQFGVQRLPSNSPKDGYVADKDYLSLIVDESIALRNGYLVEHNDNEWESDDWASASASSADMWKFEFETTEEGEYTAVNVC